MTETIPEQTAPPSRPADEDYVTRLEGEIEARLKADVERAMRAGFLEGRRHQRELDAALFRDPVKLCEWMRRHNFMFVVTARGIELTSRAAAEYIKWNKIEGATK